MNLWKLLNVNTCVLSMAMNTIAASLYLWKASKNQFFVTLFEKKSIFDEYLPPKNYIIDKILWQISLKLSAQDSKYVIGFSKFL